MHLLRTLQKFLFTVNKTSMWCHAREFNLYAAVSLTLLEVRENHRIVILISRGLNFSSIGGQPGGDCVCVINWHLLGDLSHVHRAVTHFASCWQFFDEQFHNFMTLDATDSGLFLREIASQHQNKGLFCLSHNCKHNAVTTKFGVLQNTSSAIRLKLPWLLFWKYICEFGKRFSG